MYILESSSVKTRTNNMIWPEMTWGKKQVCGSNIRDEEEGKDSEDIVRLEMAGIGKQLDSTEGARRRPKGRNEEG